MSDEIEEEKVKVTNALLEAKNKNDKNGEEKAILVEVEENPLLKKIQMPGQKFGLPSRGLFYKNGELAKHVKNAEVEVFPMKTIDEINLKSPDMIFQGTAITSVFQRCIPDIKKPLELLSHDVDFLMGVLRRVSYGSHIPIKAACDCTKRKKMREYQIPLDDMLFGKTTVIDEENIDKNYTFELVNDGVDPAQKQHIQLNPLRFKDVVEFYQFRATEIDKLAEIKIEDINDAVQNDIEEYTAMEVASAVESIDGHDNKQHIKEWAKGLSVELKNKVIDKLDTIPDWGTKFSYTVECFDCNKGLDITASLNPVGFFSQPSSRTKVK